MTIAPVFQSLAENVIHPPAGFGITYLAPIPLGSGKVSVSENDLADDFNGCAGTACISCGMSPQIMGTDFDADLSAGFFDDLPGTGVADRKNPLVRCQIFCSYIIPESGPDFLWDKNHLVLPSAFGADQKELAILNISDPEL